VVVINPISDITTAALHAALNGLETRQQVIAANVANLETPGYLARDVNFEDSLRAAVDAGRPQDSAVSVETSLAPTRLNGNNVNIDEQIMSGSENVLRQQLVIQGLNSKYNILRTAITGR
jgi:flagellar basal-body rod protein FlgB